MILLLIELLVEAIAVFGPNLVSVSHSQSLIASGTFSFFLNRVYMNSQTTKNGNATEES